ncbi:MAG TPA: hypothetical protein VF299_11040 [Mycobacterium sp.]
MTTTADDREALAQLAEQLGWERKAHERVDVYVRGLVHVHAIWRDNNVLNGGAHYDDGILQAHSTDLTKVQTWLAK